MGRPINDEKIRQALAVNEEFILWQSGIASKKLEKKTIQTRMRHAMSGVAMGITLETVLHLCKVNQEDFVEWIALKENSEKMGRALASAEAHLEYVVHQYAKLDPVFALQVLVKRNPKRWDTKEMKTFDKGVKAGKKMSELMSKVKKKEVFDVTV